MLAFLSGFVIYPALMILLTPILYWPTTLKLILWVLLTLYTLLLARWSRTNLTALFFPLALLLGSALWPSVYMGFFLLLPGILAWIRSGICFRDKPVRAVLAESVTIIGGMGLMGVWGPHSMLQWSLCIWLFGLVQCLYFYITSHGFLQHTEKETTGSVDPFESSAQEVERILSRS